jgi:uncharacterized membrane protein YdjX (TVP38/TMEM64 family)
MDCLSNCLEGLTAWLRTTDPAILLVAMTLLPLAGVPSSPLWVLAGVRFGPFLGTLVACSTLVVNIGLGYWLSARWFRSGIEQWLTHRGYRIPKLAEKDEWKFILLLRIAPAVPLTLQNYLLGCARVRFARYLVLSLPAQWAYALAFVWFGDSLTRSSLWRVALAICLVGAVVLFISLARRWSGNSHVAGAAVLNRITTSHRD